MKHAIVLGGSQFTRCIPLSKREAKIKNQAGFFVFDKRMELNSVFWAEPNNLQNLSILENLATRNRTPTFHPSAPQAYQYFISLFLASLGACNMIFYIHDLINWQLSK